MHIRSLRPVLVAGFFVGSLVALVACAKPTTMAPTAHSSEIKAEQQNLQQMATKSQKAGGQNISKEQAQAKLANVAPKIIQGARQTCVAMGIDPATCVYDFVIQQDNALNAYADGKKVYVTTAMLAFVQYDNELALILGHEYAHNVMQHVASKKKNVTVGALLGVLADGLAASQGFNTQGEFSKTGAQIGSSAYSQDFEREADYVGMYIASAAGYTLEHVAEFWRRFAVEQPGSIYGSGTHPTSAERYLNITRIESEIDHKRAAKQPLVPNRQPKAS